MNEIKTVAAFKESIKEPAVVEFFATWCSFCKAAEKPFKAAAAAAGGVKSYKVDVEKLESTADEFNVQSMPTFIAFKDGKEVAREVGSVPRKKLDALFEQAK